ncbi:MAG: hypothetical protein Pg6C_12720 [Treponemataceae bacterium]|nr:MAG: hypothetical protein Pg6C_12720 [Treponemataceae bacterium]
MRETVSREGAAMGLRVTVKALCGKAEMTRQNYYKERSVRRREVDGRHTKDLVKRERRIQPRLGGRKLFHILAPNQARADDITCIRTDKVFYIWRSFLTYGHAR